MAETRTAPPAGYKSTDLGPLPEEWEAVRLGDLATRTFGGGTPSTKGTEFWGGPIPWTTTAVIGEEDTYFTRVPARNNGGGLTAFFRSSSTGG